MNRPQDVCALLFYRGWLRRGEAPGLQDPALRDEIERRLGLAGYELVDNFYGDHYGLRMLPEVAANAHFEPASNMGLQSPHLALITILWGKLALPKRAEYQRGVVRGQNYIVESSQLAASARSNPTVLEETIYQEFKETLGLNDRETLRRHLTQLRRLGFIERVAPPKDAARGTREYIAGPLLEIAIDGSRMSDFIRENTILSEVLRRAAQMPDSRDSEDPASTILRALEGGQRRTVAEITLDARLDPELVRATLNGLKAEAIIRATQSADPRYYIPTAEPPDAELDEDEEDDT